MLADLWLKPIGLVQGSAAAWCCSAFIRWTKWTMAMAVPWWQHHKRRPSCYYCYYAHRFTHGCVIVDGDDATQCCATKGLTGACLGICSGNITNFPADIRDCESHVDTYYSCYNISVSTTVTPTTPGKRLGLTCRMGAHRKFSSCCKAFSPSFFTFHQHLVLYYFSTFTRQFSHLR